MVEPLEIPLIPVVVTYMQKYVWLKPQREQCLGSQTQFSLPWIIVWWNLNESFITTHPWVPSETQEIPVISGMPRLFLKNCHRGFEDRVKDARTRILLQYLPLKWVLKVEGKHYIIVLFIKKKFFLAAPRGLRDFSSLTRDQTRAPCSGSTES